MDDDWRGLDREWFRQIGRGWRPGRAGIPFDELRRYFEATRDRRPRPVRWVVCSQPPRSAEEERLAAMASELGLDQRGERHLDAAELMERFQDDERASRWPGASSPWASAGARAPTCA